jgi:hypothetical protein
VSSVLDDARAIREAIVDRALDIYEPPTEHPEVVYSRDELEELLKAELVGAILTGPLRTRNKLAKQRVCRALGYPVPTSFRRVKPRFPGQDLDIHVQQRDNVQIYNVDELSPTRRHALIRVDEAGTVTTVRVLEGVELAAFDRTGTLTSKYQATRRGGVGANRLVSTSDTTRFVRELAPSDSLGDTVLGALLPVNRPVHGTVLSVRALYDRLLGLVGREMEYSTSERLRGERLHRLACETLGLGSYADTGRFPDIVCQALEVKVQTSPTIDLGLVAPDSEEPALTLSPRLRHADARYLVAYAVHDTAVLRVEHIVVCTGADFFDEFQRFGGLGQNTKLQIPLPGNFFEAE